MTRTERTYILVTALWNFPAWFMTPVYPLFLLSRGLDLFEMSAILAAFFFAVFLLEVPTGAVADLYGRKVSVLCSCVVRMIAFAAYSIGDGFFWFLACEMVDAVGVTLQSGALDAWAVDGVREEGVERPADAMFARAAVTVRAAMIVGGLLSGLLADRYGFTVPWLVAAATFGGAGVVAAMTMKRDLPRAARGRASVADGPGAIAAASPERGVAGPAASDPSLAFPPADTRARAALGRTVTEGLAVVRGSPVMRAICLVTAIGAFAMMPVIQTWPPRLEALSGEGKWILGWAWAALNLAAVIGGTLLTRLVPRLSRERLLVGIAVWRAVMLTGAAVATAFLPALGFLLLYEVGLSMTFPVLTGWMNEHVDGELRATVLSVEGMSFTFGGALGLLSLGLVGRQWGIAAGWLVAAAVCVLLAGAAWRLGRVANGAANGVAPRPLRS